MVCELSFKLYREKEKKKKEEREQRKKGRKE